MRMRVQARVRMRVSGAAGPRQCTGRGQCMGQKLPLVYLALGSRPCKVLGRPPCSWPAESPPCRCGLSWIAGTRTPGPWGRGSFLRTRKTSRCSQLLRCPIWGGWWLVEPGEGAGNLHSCHRDRAHEPWDKWGSMYLHTCTPTSTRACTCSHRAKSVKGVQILADPLSLGLNPSCCPNGYLAAPPPPHWVLLKDQTVELGSNSSCV